MKTMMKVPLVLEPQKEGGWTITSPLIPELVTEIDELDNLNSTVNDALAAVIELYQDMGKQFPTNLQAGSGEAPQRPASLMTP